MLQFLGSVAKDCISETIRDIALEQTLVLNSPCTIDCKQKNRVLTDKQAICDRQKFSIKYSLKVNITHRKLGFASLKFGLQALQA